MKKGMKTKVVILVLCLAVLLIGGVLSGCHTEEPAPTSAVEANWDISWYDENGTEFTISTMDQFYGLAELSRTRDFKGQIIKLGADIVINEGDASQWVDKAPEKLWTPITGFAGTFDGQGYTVSGVYGNSIVTSLGLFTDTQKGCVIKNLNLVNSCFKNNNDMGTGSIIGVGGGKLENIYSDAVLVSSGKYVGGLIGCVKTKGENQITNCWFDGTITMDGYDSGYVGGLVGAYAVEDAINNIAHCLSTADITCMGENVGGICGNVGSGSFLNLNDSMFTGTLVYDTNKYAVVGSVIGQVMGSGSIIVENTYTVDELANRTIGTSAGYQKGNAIALDKNYLVGAAGYQWTTLVFDSYWVVQKDSMPRLKHFTEATESLEGVQKMVDVSWYDPTGASFEITNVQQFYGFAYLSRSYDFRGQTIKLGADITVNEGDASTWGENAPDYNWTPIAWYGSSLSQRFKGTFDGQGHTISGIYCKGTENITSLGLFGEVYHGAVVKNFKLVNSYFEGVLTSDVRGPVGSIAGRLRGTIENVYSDAIVVNSAKNTGGIVGMIIGTGQNKISGCWFDGEIYGITRSGGILGGVYGNKGNIEATIEHCLNTGNIHVEIGQAAVGGICGSVETWSILYVNDCLNAGTFQTVGEGKAASTHVGTLIGTVTETDGVGSQAIISHSYGTKEFYDRLVGWKHGDDALSQSSMMFVNRSELRGYGGYRWTTLDFNNHWAVRMNDVPVPVAFAENSPSVAGVTRMVDYSWYDPAKNVYVIYNFRQLYGMARLWDTTNLFKGKTILLGADITVNQGNAADWAEKAPAFIWEPMKFNGTFDGQGHTISGIYVKGGTADNYVGFFHRIYQNGTVKNLKLTNSYIEGTMDAGTRGAVGSLAGRSNGIIDTVYSDAIVVNSARMTGGLVGMITGEGQNVIRNSWFNGSVTGINRTGGILGGIYGNKADITVTIDTCTNTGDVAVKIGSGDVGGICGIAETGGTLNITNCVNAGTFATIGDDKEANTHIGSIFGSVTNNGVASHVVLDNVYGVKEFYSKLVGWKYGAEGISASAAVMLDREMLTADGGYRYTALDYEKAWGLNGGNVPVPAAFATTTVDGSNQLDYSWYDAGKSEYVITTPAQLEAFNVLCNAESNYFSGKTVKLGADIILTDGTETAPNWTPNTFSGIFDGQGHTVSGVYVKSDKQYNGFFHTIESGAVVKNLKLKDSCIDSAYTGKESRAGVGSIAGRNRGTIEAVYSNAVVINSKNMTGGIAGMSEGGVIRNCWFDGEIHGARATGGILGGAYAKAATIERCLNTGVLNVQENSYYVGGICGELQNAASAQITDCLNAGTLVGTVVKSGAVVGRVDTKASLVMTDAYGIKEFQATAVGDCTGKLEGGSYAVRVLDNLKGYGAYQWTTLGFEGGAWVLKKDTIPALGAFDVTDLSLEEAKKLPDFTWYDENSDTYVITTVRQMYAMNELASSVDYFGGKTVMLGADITLNEGNAADWAANAPENMWTPVNFSGTFDGQGHTVSGLYVNSTKTYNGLFGTVNGNAVVKNLKLVNSYIEGNGSSTRSGVGSIAGRNHGVIENIYTNAILKNNKHMTGGIVGMATKTSGSVIRNCWFDGIIYSIDGAGGILGCSYGQKVTVEHCLNTGALNVASGKWVGGLVGYVQGAGNVTVTDSLNAGSLAAAEGVDEIGTIVGRLDDKGTLTFTGVYGVTEFNGNALGYLGSGTLSSTASSVWNREKLLGYSAYQYTKLDFENGTWVLKKDAIPVLGLFDTTDLSLEEAKKLPDYSWYDENASEYVITTAGQLLGFNSLCGEDNDYFKGKTVKLGADITLNEGNAADWAAAAPAKAWKPIKFKGSFDGQGHSVSGVYVKETGENIGFFSYVYSGAVIKNLKLTNSYIEHYGNASNNRSAVGSIAGQNHGTIDTVYTNAILKNNKQMTGGIVGMVSKAAENTIRNCWFDGTIDAINGTGGILGSSYGQTVTIEHCLNTGTLNVTSGSQVGGLVGYVQGAANVTISDSLNAGTLNAAEGVKQMGTIVGSLHDKAILTLTNAYGIKEFKENAVGYISKGALVDNGYAVRNLADIQDYGAYQFTKLDFESGIWGMKKDAIPLLGAFAAADLSVEDAKSLPTYDWYDVNAETYVITNIQQMRGYAELCGREGFVKKPITMGSDLYVLNTAEQMNAFAALCADDASFSGKTVQLGADIVLTEWTPVRFDGIFDGQGHSISGLPASLFDALDGATVKNLKLTNSVALKATDSLISNCVLTNAEANMLGVAMDGTCVEHCYSDGGLIADVQGITTVSDSLAAGTAVTSAQMGKLTMTSVYGIGDANGSVAVADTAYIARKLDDLKGYGAYQWTTLDFAANWVLKKDAIPVLKLFNADTSTDLSLEEAKKLTNFSWYDANAETHTLATASHLVGYVELRSQDGFVEKSITLSSNTYILSTKEELLAFNSLCTADTDFFNGKTVKLGASITLNEGNAAGWAAEPPAVKWVNQEFKGVFDGSGYTISGVYVKSGTHAGFFKMVRDGAAVRNLRLVNSLIENTKTSGRTGTGSIAGRSYGTIENVYSSAIVKSNSGALMTGGIVGMIDANGQNMISNCWFDGTIYGKGSTGGILGGTYGKTATIEHCLNTGSIHVEDGTAIGGLCGYAQSSGGVIIRDSLNAGTFVQGSGTIKQLGTIIGAVHKSATATKVANVYGATEFANKLYGYTDGANPVEVEADTVCEMKALADLYGTGAANLNFDSYWVARDEMIPVLKIFS